MTGVIHCGAWHGLEYIGSQQRLLLFEPVPEAFDALSRNLADNPDAVLVNKAVGSVAVAAVTMHTTVPTHSSSLLTPQGPVTADHPVYFDGTITVDVTTVDDEMRDRIVYDVLRIDTQGYELEVLKGATATLKTLRRVELELHDSDTYLGAASLVEIDAFMSAHGWAQTGIDVVGSDSLADVTYEPRC